MEVTKWLKPSNSGHDLVTARVCAGCNASERRASLEKVDVQADPAGSRFRLSSVPLGARYARRPGGPKSGRPDTDRMRIQLGRPTGPPRNR